MAILKKGCLKPKQNEADNVSYCFKQEKGKATIRYKLGLQCNDILKRPHMLDISDDRLRDVRLYYF